MAHPAAPSERPVVARGVTLLEVMRSDCLAPAQLRTIVVAIALHVASAHGRGAIVGPVHPHDVQLTDEGRPVVGCAAAPRGWSDADDVAMVRRWARALLGEELDVTSARDAVSALAVGGEVTALPALRQPARCAPRRRWWGRAS